MRPASVWDSGSLARLHRTTHGWFLSRAMSSSMARRCTSCVAALIVSSEIGRPRAAEEQSASDAKVEPDRSRLVDDDDALAVGLFEHLLGVGVVGGPKGVGADPREEREVVQHRRVVVAAAVHVEVLVLAEAPEVEGLVVDEELRALDPHGADADRERVAVDDGVIVVVDDDELDLQVVEVPRPGPHSSGSATRRTPSAPSAAATTTPLGVAEPHTDGLGAASGDADVVADDTDPVVEVGRPQSRHRRARAVSCRARRCGAGRRS